MSFDYRVYGFAFGAFVTAGVLSSLSHFGVVVPYTGIVSFVGGGAIGAAAWMYSPLPDANYVRGGAIRPGAGYWGFSEPGDAGGDA